MFLEFVAALADREAARCRKWRHPRCGKRKASPVFILDDAGRLIPEFFIQPLMPQVGRLHHVRIRRYNAHLRHFNDLLMLSAPASFGPLVLRSLSSIELPYVKRRARGMA